MLTQIKSWWTGAVLFEVECELSSESLRLGFAVKAAIAARANLTGANLTDADLAGANLTRANLTDADLAGANLTDADLADANLTGANLTDANLTGANLTDADLTRANLTDADLAGANLTGANLTGANLTRANLTQIRDDIWAVLSSAPREVPNLREALVTGRVDGSTYSGECCCLVGTLAKARGCDEYGIPGLQPNASRAAEKWFMGIKKGDTPESSKVSAITLAWVDEWLANVRQLVGA